MPFAAIARVGNHDDAGVAAAAEPKPGVARCGPRRRASAAREMLEEREKGACMYGRRAPLKYHTKRRERERERRTVIDGSGMLW